LPFALAADDARVEAPDLGYSESLKYPGPNFFILLACKPGTIAYRENMIPKLGEILKTLKVNESMSDVFEKLEKIMEEDLLHDQVPVKVSTCNKKIYLKRIYPKM